MHHIYTTKAFVIHSTPHGEASKFLILFTRDFGMIGAVAQGVRLSHSKLRYHTQDFSFSNISVVRGKEVWRLTGALEVHHQKINIVYLKVLKLLRRLLHGEERNEKLFEIIECLFLYKVEEYDYESVECITVLRILYILGYVKNTDKFSIFLENNLLNKEIINLFMPLKKEIISVINSALKESQL